MNEDEFIQEVNKLLAESFKCNEGSLSISEGKRLRPRLLYRFYVALINDKGFFQWNTLVNVAVSIEQIHESTLVLDDVLDDSKMRRGELSFKERNGENIAILTSNLMIIKSAKRIMKHINLAKNFYLLEKLLFVAEELVTGELQQQQYNPSEISEKEYLETLRRKTGMLFGLSFELAGIIAGCDSKVKKRLWDFGLLFGVFYQIIDDVKDLLGQVKETGKDYQNDRKNNKDFLDHLISKDFNVMQKTESMIWELISELKSQLKGIVDKERMHVIVEVIDSECLLFKDLISEKNKDDLI